ncbi:MAG: hypothetical protein ACI9MC_001443 [Kiritimatiellia bacterium]|jgi:hypothetical protein
MAKDNAADVHGLVAQVARESRGRAGIAVWLDLLLATLKVAVVTIEAVVVERLVSLSEHAELEGALAPLVRCLRDEGMAWDVTHVDGMRGAVTGRDALRVMKGGKR